MKTILLVDDEDYIIEILKELLEEKGYKIFTATDGKSAKDIISLQRPDLIVSDIKMKQVNGIELFHWSKQFGVIPFILMTGFADIIDLEEAVEMGVSDLIEKPIDFKDFSKKVAELLNVDEESMKQSLKPEYYDDQFCQIDVQKFVTGKSLPCSIFIRLRENKFVKLADKGGSYKIKDFEKYTKKLKYLYVFKEEFRQYLGLNINIARAMGEGRKVAKAKVYDFVKTSTEILMENIYVNELSQELYQDSCEFAKASLNLMSDSSSIMNLLMSMNEKSHSLYTHCLTTALYAVMISKKVGWHKDSTTFSVFMAGIMHDVGLEKMDEELFRKNPSILSDDEVKMFNTHPTRGMEILNALEEVPAEVVLAAYQHHEDCLGHGFPLGITKQKISPISRLISVADCIRDNLVREKGGSVSDYASALRQVDQFKRKHYDTEFLDAFKDILGITKKKVF